MAEIVVNKTKTSGANPLVEVNGQPFILRNDLTTSQAGDVTVIKINADGTEGEYARTFSRFAISFGHSTSKETTEFNTGTGNNITLTASETDTFALVTNGFNPDFHALVTNKIVRKNQMQRVLKSEDVLIAKAGTDPDFTYSYTWAGETAPTLETNGSLKLYVINETLGGIALQQTKATEGTPLSYDQYSYDVSTKTLSVSKEHSGNTLTVKYMIDKVGVTSQESSDSISNAEFKIIAETVLQSVSGSTLYINQRTVARGKLTGDYNGLTLQKDANNEITYTFTAQEPPSGEKKYNDQVFEKD